MKVLPLAFALIGCASDSASTGPESSSDGKLSIIDLSSTVTKLTDGESVQFIAIVTHEAGLENIAGGKLVDETGAVYGAFGAGTQKGTYTATVSWDLAHQVRSIGFSSAAGESRQFSALFFDNAAATATATIPLQFYCASGFSCGGECLDVTGIGPKTSTCTNVCGSISCEGLYYYDSSCHIDYVSSCSSSLTNVPVGQAYVCAHANDSGNCH